MRSLDVAFDRIRTLEEQLSRRDREFTRFKALLLDQARVLERLSQVELNLARLSARVESLVSAPPPKTRPAPFPSLIVSALPDLFADFRDKPFKLLWRGTRGGFGAGDFHSRCDKQSNTLTLIRDTHDIIFGGFTPTAWESRSCSTGSISKADPTLRSFLFTLQNPHRVPPRIFKLRPQGKDDAIVVNVDWGPHFSAIGVCDQCDKTAKSFAFEFDDDTSCPYENDTGISDGETFFTQSAYFTVKEIEVFQIG